MKKFKLPSYNANQTKGIVVAKYNGVNRESLKNKYFFIVILPPTILSR